MLFGIAPQPQSSSEVYVGILCGDCLTYFDAADETSKMANRKKM